MKVSFVRDIPGLGDRIRQARQEQKLSLIDLWQRCGISASQIGRIEQEKVEIANGDTIARICKALSIDVFEGESW